ncbi:sulfotransferase domain-containing protein [Sulfurimonas sp. HSL-1716]|uniref:sulfotransferase domain-containing protein n=1 Tax=Hydrocurvibacter sulfurireducens TaxID=3131937 RepID=UPI0031F7AF14
MIENIYHCGIQKSATQWIRNILSDPLILERSNKKLYAPSKDYLWSKRDHDDLLAGFELNSIVTPLYIDYESFLYMKKPDSYRAFWIMRDPRDVITSLYFSYTFSHPIIDEDHARDRKILQSLNQEAGFNYFLEKAYDFYNAKNPLYTSLLSWLESKDNASVRVVKYEDLIGARQKEIFSELFQFLDIALSSWEVDKILDKYSFKAMTQDRDVGVENKKSHYRKGQEGDWKNYFSNEHKKRFKIATADLLIQLGYETDMDW